MIIVNNDNGYFIISNDDLLTITTWLWIEYKLQLLLVETRSSCESHPKGVFVVFQRQPTKDCHCCKADRNSSIETYIKPHYILLYFYIYIYTVYNYETLSSINISVSVYMCIYMYYVLALPYQPTTNRGISNGFVYL